LIGHGVPAQAQDTGGTTVEAVEQLSSDYTAVAGGWWLDERCRILAFDQKIEFEWLVGELTEAIAGELGTGWTNSRQQSAQEIAFDIPCDAEAANLIGDRSRWRVVTDQLTGLVYTQGVTDREYLLGRYSSLAQVAVADAAGSRPMPGAPSIAAWSTRSGSPLGQRHADVDFKSLATDAQLEVDNRDRVHARPRCAHRRFLRRHRARG
jgi:hypothetical protein